MDLGLRKTISHDFFAVKFQIISICPAFNILYFKLTGKLTRSRNNKVGIVSILKNNIGRAKGLKVRSGDQV